MFMDHTIIHHVLQAIWFPQLHYDCWRIKTRYKYIMVHTRKSKVFESVLLFVSNPGEPPKKKREIFNETAESTWFFSAFFGTADLLTFLVEESNMNLGQLGSPQIGWLKVLLVENSPTQLVIWPPYGGLNINCEKWPLLGRVEAEPK